ncbi:MAG: GtrA family protein [Acidothermus sp.]|nr:GtrA family protein [Acidothermus sp.]
MKIISALYRRFAHLVHEIAKFGIVGFLAFIVDVGLFNVLRSDGAPLHDKVITAKAISTVVAATFAYFANRHWTWRARMRSGLRREYTLFFVFNAIGLAIAEACLAISHYGLGFHSKLADNISANGIGLVLGTLFRFWSYRRWVFLAVKEPERSEQAAGAAIV